MPPKLNIPYSTHVCPSHHLNSLHTAHDVPWVPPRIAIHRHHCPTIIIIGMSSDDPVLHSLLSMSGDDPGRRRRRFPRVEVLASFRRTSGGKRDSRGHILKESSKEEILQYLNILNIVSRQNSRAMSLSLII